jgi:hypothetical protein
MTTHQAVASTLSRLANRLSLRTYARRAVPKVIGATGGSGTRVMARLTRRGGTFIGTLLNEADDAINIGLFLNRWIPPYLESEHRGKVMAADAAAEMARDFQAALARHLEPMAEPMAYPGGPYGWKEPRSIYLLPFFHAQFPGMRFLHLIRDGRDMAFSTNQNQLNQYGDLMVPSELAGWPRPVRSIALWSRINRWAADYGESRMRGQYLRVRFEDLCAEPVAQVRRVFDFLGLEGDPAAAARSELAPPESIGRWRGEDPEILGALHEHGGAALRRFGYL